MNVAQQNVLPVRIPATSTSLALTEHTPAQRTPLEQNKQIEQQLSDHIVNHPAAKQVMSTLLNSLADVFIQAQGEFRGWADIIQAASHASDSNRNGNGVLAPRFDVIGHVGWNGPAIKSTMKDSSIREQGTLFLNILLSPTFKELMNQTAQDTTLQQKLADVIDVDYLKSKQGNLYKMTGWTAQTAESRKQVAKADYHLAESLLATNKITTRELNFHRHNPVNSPAQQSQVGYNTPALADSELAVLRGYGKDIWQVAPESEFANRANEMNKPVICGPSGSTLRLMNTARLLAPNCKEKLGLDSDQSFLELARFAAYGYFVQDQHHSMLEVNLGAAASGLKEQWGDELYTQPFSQPITNGKLNIGNEQCQHLVQTITEI